MSAAFAARSTAAAPATRICTVRGTGYSFDERFDKDGPPSKSA